MSVKITSSKYDLSKKSTQSKFTKGDIQQKLKGYKKVTSSTVHKIQPGDKIRYFVDNEFRMGGSVKINKYPDYIVLLNPFKNISWCIQFKEPTLKLYIKTLEMVKRENIERDLIYEKWKNGELCEKK